MASLMCVKSAVNSAFVEGKIYTASTGFKTVVGEDGDTSEPWELQNLSVVNSDCGMVAKFKICK
ncbi:hypothetical protein HGT70_03835 [Rosenbergiella collisarenosi]|uniref:hypothetical protein n=1 Tax=Rosenbergiella collisarenosi TaxID=1544695 RepID=UPI001BD99DA1|nr:hypothetical protein [Rosenbergiella collisarenosi]MBT0720411.1 hypothetical protein [Rosenbergiella collisarenosi]